MFWTDIQCFQRVVKELEHNFVYYSEFANAHNRPPGCEFSLSTSQIIVTGKHLCDCLWFFMYYMYHGPLSTCLMRTSIHSWALERCGQKPISQMDLLSTVLPGKLVLVECHRTPLMMSTLVQVMAWHQMELIMTCCQSDHLTPETNFSEIRIKMSYFPSRKLYWIWCLQNIVHLSQLQCIKATNNAGLLSSGPLSSVKLE